MEETLKGRLDKWLVAARFFKTRSLAQKAIIHAQVLYNNQRATVSRLVQIGAVLKIKQGFDDKTVVVKGLSDVRKSASEAQLLYEETEESIELRAQNKDKRQLAALSRGNPKPLKRPNKADRRKLRQIRDK